MSVVSIVLLELVAVMGAGASELLDLSGLAGLSLVIVLFASGGGTAAVGSVTAPFGLPAQLVAALVVFGWFAVFVWFGAVRVEVVLGSVRWDFFSMGGKSVLSKKMLTIKSVRAIAERKCQTSCES